jgi:tyrosyl-tRNA synthetase
VPFVARAPDVGEQLRILAAGTVDVISEGELERKLERAATAGTPLRVKLGIDPTASDIHLGFAVVLRKLRRFQDLGHLAVLILGDFTAGVGDPSGRSATRPPLSPTEIDAHATTYVEQVTRILDPHRLEVRRNSEWLGGMGIADVLGLAARTTVAQMLERDDFARRYQGGAPISVTELLYPLLQGWDSVQVAADVELGGTDQLFNMLVGRDLQGQEDQEPQVVLTTPLLVGIDGVQKMSKSLGNYVGITEPAAEQFGKLMRISDDLMPRYLELTTGWHPDRVEEVLTQLSGADAAARNATKRLLARTVVELYHEGAGAAAEAEFDRVFKEQQPPSDVPEFVLPARELIDGRIRLSRLLARADLVTSSNEGGRKIAQGGVRIDGTRVDDPDLELAAGELDGRLVQVGKRRWARIRVG